MNDDYKVEVKEVQREAGGKRLRVGVIGVGIGRKHIEGWQQHASVDVVAIADPDRDRLDKVGEQYGIAARYPSAE